MVTNIDAVGVKIDADNTGLRTGLQGAEADINRFSQRAVASLQLVTIASAALVTGLAGLAVGAGIQSLSKVASELEDIGVRAGTIGILASELQELGHVARRVDVEQEKLNAGLEKFTVFLGQARLGAGPLASALTQINPVLLEQLKNTTNVREAFLLLADATAGLTTKQDQLSLAQAAFSRGGTDLVRVLALGREGILDLAKEGTDLGFVFSDLAIQAGGELSDKIEDASKAFDHQLKKALIDLAPVIIGFIDLGTMVIASLRGITAAIKDMFSTSTRETVNALSTSAAELEKRIEGLNKSLEANPRGGMGSMISKQLEQKKAELAAVREQLQIAEDDLIRQNSGPMGPPAPPAVAAGALPRNFADEEKAAREAAKAAKKDEIEQQRLHNAELAKYNDLRKLQHEIEMMIDPVQARLAKTQLELGAALQKSAIDADMYAVAMSKAVAVAANAYADGAASIARDLGKVFEGNKAVAIATALINTFQSVTNAWANVPWPLNIAAAAAALAAGMAQVANIRKTTAKGGGSAGAGSSGGAGSGGGVTQIPQQLMVQGINRDEFFSGAQIGPLVKQLLKFQADGGQVVLQQ